ncbi:MAG: hypothetical protein QM780_04775 [Hyphomicrobium sp.]|uniref:hypothetical protein n=1 Tax=Hyphomicrobium sp. TaxID=82 RepID=UPI0039E22ABF
MKNVKVILIAVASLIVGGCGATLPKLPTTGSLLGGSDTSKENRDPNDPVARAMGVAATSARAVKCGYNFDPAKLKSQYLASETAHAPALGDKLSQVYDTAFAGVTTAISEKEKEEQYCLPERTARIKEALNRNLAGDYTPPPSESPEDSGGLFSGWGSNNSGNGEGGAKMKEMMAN